MAKYSKFLFFYCLIVTTVLLVVPIFLSPRPYVFSLIPLFLPVNFYFWAKITEPEKTSPGRWSVRIVIIILALSTLGVLAFWLAPQSPPRQQAGQLPASPTGGPYVSPTPTASPENIDAKDLLELLEYEEATPSASPKLPND